LNLQAPIIASVFKVQHSIDTALSYVEVATLFL